MGFDWLFLSGAAEIVQLLCEGESQPAAAGQAGNEHFERHAGDAKLGKEFGLQEIKTESWKSWVGDSSVLDSDEMDLWSFKPSICLSDWCRGPFGMVQAVPSPPAGSPPCCRHDIQELPCPLFLGSDQRHRKLVLKTLQTTHQWEAVPLASEQPESALEHDVFTLLKGLRAGLTLRMHTHAHVDGLWETRP